MTVLNAHFEGKQVVLDDPVPENIPASAKVRVTVECETEGAEVRQLREGLMGFAGALKDGPPDFARNHDYYLHGTPRT